MLAMLRTQADKAAVAVLWTMAGQENCRAPELKPSRHAVLARLAVQQPVRRFG